jgi:serine/threonine protein phosphatase PrpC
MQNTTTTLYCPNCQSPNPLSYKLCQQCQTPLPKRYLWVAGQAIEGYRRGDLLEGRYLFQSSRVLLDTQPGWTAENQLSISEAVEPYLKLFPYRLHIPQVYGTVWLKEKPSGPQEILLLEQAPVGHGDLLGTFNPNLSIDSAVPLELAWFRMSALRQLNWLWQMAQLWQPFSSQRVVSSLLQPELLRVEGPLVRLLELRLDQYPEPTLADLGQLWLQWVPNSQPVIATSLKTLCQQMVQGQVRTAEQLMNQLEQWLRLVGLQSCQVEIATRTDQGPSRQQNEDACYPPDGAVVTSPPLTVICDGVGGHAGGAIASTLAIETLKQQLQPIQIESANPKDLMAELEDAVCVANDAISQRNDSEQRHDRQRMGTTLVMALARAHEMYITHAGDSRAYWITRSGCYQVTLDDDIASREVRLGYTSYRNALQQPASGSLVQALGMGPSAILHPTVQRFVLDEDCIFLLCSDGLSDNDRVEEHWEAEILPILDGKIDLATASQRLITIANTQNGHDNVTVSLVHCQIIEAKDETLPELLLTDLDLDPTVPSQSSQDPANSPSLHGITSSTPSTLKTQILRPKHSVASPWFLLGTLLLLGLGGLGAYLLIPSLNRQVNAWVGLGPTPSEAEQVSQPPQISPSPVVPLPSPSPSLAVGSLIQITSSAPGNPQAQATSITLLRQSGRPQAVEGSVLAGSVLQVKERVTLRQQGNWLRVKVCSSPSVPLSPSVNSTAKPSTANPAAVPALQPGATGWVQEPVMTKVALPTTLSQQRLCATNSPQS